ncbi:MAG: hypothetical protein HDT33_03645 [Clostridiales bacterium]|nr:hypothetical protein [Clostridiales bacterium]
MSATTENMEDISLQTVEDIFNFLRSGLPCPIDGRVILTDDAIYATANNLYRALINDAQSENQPTTDNYKEDN